MKCEITGEKILNKFRVERTPKIDLTPSVIIDFDGTIYAGEFDEKSIIGNPVITNLGCSSIVYIRKLHKEGIPIKIFSCRNTQIDGVKLMKAWLRGNGLEEEIIHSIEFPTHKPYGIYIDDNCALALKYGVYFPTIDEVKEWLEQKGR